MTPPRKGLFSVKIPTPLENTMKLYTFLYISIHCLVLQNPAPSGNCSVIQNPSLSRISNLFCEGRREQKVWTFSGTAKYQEVGSTMEVAGTRKTGLGSGKSSIRSLFYLCTILQGPGIEVTIRCPQIKVKPLIPHIKVSC